jgi:hypothetical protein
MGLAVKYMDDGKEIWYNVLWHSTEDYS